MPEGASRPSPPIWVWLALATVVIVADQTSKNIVVAHFIEGESLAVNPIFSLVLAYNSGAAFSFLAGAGGWQRGFFIALSSIASILIVALLRRHREEPLLCIALGFILGGALGNLIDRILIGRVVDFLLFHWDTAAFPAFNLADSAITLGAALLILDSLRGVRGVHRQA
jgi:signal peptidase II